METYENCDPLIGGKLEPAERLSTVLFDFDGTLVSLNAQWETLRDEMRSLLEPYGFMSSFVPVFRSLAEAEMHLANRFGPSIAGKTMAKIWDVFREIELHAVEHSQLLPGVPEVWQWLDAHGVPKAIVSNNHTDAVRAALARFGVTPPKVIIGRDQVNHFKPNPEGALKALKELGRGVRGCWIVGDSIYDAEVGMALDLRIAMVRRPSRTVQLPPEQEVFVITRLDELIDIWKPLCP